MIAWAELEPEYIEVKFADQEAQLIHYRLGRGQRRVLVIAKQPFDCSQRSRPRLP